ncbi:MAG: LapA family protein [Proteobacteria bacterium]|nr:LapA family protein [Pseudomonadota bacterium]
MTWLAKLFWVATLLIIFFLCAVAVNQSQIALQFLIWRTPQIGVFWWLLLAFGCGLFVGALGIPISKARQGLKHRRLTKELSASNQELAKLRNLTLND